MNTPPPIPDRWSENDLGRDIKYVQAGRGAGHPIRIARITWLEEDNTSHKTAIHMVGVRQYKPQDRIYNPLGNSYIVYLFRNAEKPSFNEVKKPGDWCFFQRQR